MCVTIEKLLSGYRHDTILKFEDEEIKTHKEILCDNSEFFRTFYAKWDKDKNGVMCMLDTDIKDLNAFKEILKLWYYNSRRITCKVGRIMIFKDYINYLGATPLYYFAPKIKVPPIFLDELVHSYTLSYRDNDDNHAGIYQKLIVDGKQVAFTGDYENLFR